MSDELLEYLENNSHLCLLIKAKFSTDIYYYIISVYQSEINEKYYMFSFSVKKLERIIPVLKEKFLLYCKLQDHVD
jgi:hypothetical protein